MNKPIIVAEMSASHLGSLDRALAIVTAAAEAGASAIKLQTWSKDTLCVDQTYQMKTGPWARQKLFDLYRTAWLPWDFHKPIFERCAALGIECFSAPFDRESVDFLESLGCPRFKIASFELVDLDLIAYAASKKKPIILSTGMATLGEIERAYFTAKYAGATDITILKCTSAYPADASDANLAAMRNLSHTFPKVGLSDHTPGIGVAIAAVTMGASMVEKHLTLTRKDGGPDADFSMEPAEFKQLVDECNRAVSSVGKIQYGGVVGENASIGLRRSLWVVKDMKAGDMFTPDNLKSARPALGMPCSEVSFIMGAVAKTDIPACTPMSHDFVAGYNWNLP